MELTGKKITILIEDMYNELEFWYPYYRLKEAGAEVVVAGGGQSAIQFKNRSSRTGRC